MPVHLGVMGAGRCLSAFLPASGIKVEYSNDGGATWLDYGVGDADRIRLASMRDTRIWYKLGGPDASGAHGDMLRITYEPSDGRYGFVRSALVWASTMGGSNLTCGVETSTVGAKGTWVDRDLRVEMGGWPGRTPSTCRRSPSEATRTRRRTRTDGASRSARRRTYLERSSELAPSTSTATACGIP